MGGTEKKQKKKFEKGQDMLKKIVSRNDIRIAILNSVEEWKMGNKQGRSALKSENLRIFSV